MSVETHPLARCSWCGRAFVRGAVELPGGLQPWLCPSQACWKRQLERAMFVQLKGKERVCRFVPLPRQVEAMDSVDGPATYMLFGGARGGSKSKAMREIAHAKCMTLPHYRVLLLRRTFRELEDNHLINMEIEAPEMDAHFLPSQKLLRYRNDSTLRFGHCETSADAANYLSSEYDLIIFDELVTFEEQQFLLISSSARSTKAGVQPKVIAGTNPGGPQSHWVRSRFIDRNVDTVEFPDYVPEDYDFIASKLEDNPYLDKNYEKKLLALPPELRKAYRDGDWDIFPGQYFPEWRKATHISHAINPTNGQMEPTHIDYPAHLPRMLSVDWGFVKPGSCGWWVQVDGHLYREAEYIYTRTTAFDVGREIGRRCSAMGLKTIKHLVYDTAMNIPDNSTGEATIRTLVRGMQDRNWHVSTIEADKDRINGWQRLRHWFSVAPDGRPWMQSSPTCTYFNRTIPSLVSDKNKPEDVNTDGEDHSADEARYEVMAMPMPDRKVEHVSIPVGSPAWVMQKLREKRHRAFGRVA